MTWNEVVGSKAATIDATSAGSVAATMGASVPAGALMWAAVMYTGAASGHISSITGGGATWSIVGSEVQLVGPDDWLSLWAGVATSTAAHAITCNFDVARSDRGLYIGAWTGNDAAGATDGSGGSQVSSTTTPSINIATAVDGDLIIGICINGYPDTGTAGSGYTTATNSGGFRPITQETKIQSTASGTTVVDFTSVNSSTWVLVAGAFKAAAGGSIIPPGRPAQMGSGRSAQFTPTGPRPFTFVR